MPTLVGLAAIVSGVDGLCAMDPGATYETSAKPGSGFRVFTCIGVVGSFEFQMGTKSECKVLCNVP